MASQPASLGCDLTICLFGAPRLESDGQPLRFSVRPKVVPLLGYLLLHHDRATPRDELAFLLWPDDDEESARANLRRHLLYLREALPARAEPWVLADGLGVRWNSLAPARVDVLEFEREIERRETRAQGVERYAGDLLAALEDEWLIAPRERLRGRYQEALWQLACDARRRRDPGAARDYLQRLRTADPWREDAVRELMLVRYESADRAGALGDCLEFERRLRDEIGAELMPETIALREAIAGGNALPKTSVPHNLPAPTSSFVGRRTELTEIDRRLRESRLVTLVGSGGVGKTRTALMAAAEFRDELEDGVWFVDLAVVTEPGAVAGSVAKALGVRERGEGDLEYLHDYVAGRELLVILDNCEHVVAEAARIAGGLLGAAPGLRIIATSREPLGLAGESVYRMPSLSLPPADERPGAVRALEFDSVALFCTRARAVAGFELSDADAEPVVEICRRLEGIPLAIELAAARAKVLSAAELASTLDERLRMLVGGERTATPRQRTMRASIDWSYELLAPLEQLLFERLSVYVGGFTLETAISICCDDALTAADLLDLLESLVDKSLVAVDRSAVPTRYGLLESTREYAKERLAARGDERAMQVRHARGFLEYAKRLERDFTDALDPSWLGAIEHARANWNAAIGWALSPGGDVETGQRLLCTRAVWATPELQPRRLLERAISLAGEATPADVAAGLWVKIAVTLVEVGRFEDAIQPAERAVEVALRAGDLRGQTLSHQILGTTMVFAGRVAEGERHLQEAVAGYRAAGDRESLVYALIASAQACCAGGDLAGAGATLFEAREVAAGFERLTTAGEMAGAAVDLAFADMQPGDIDAQTSLFLADRALAIYRRLLTRGVPTALNTLACNLNALDRFAEAHERALEVLTLVRDAPPGLSASHAIQRIAAAVVLARRRDRAARAATEEAARLLGYAVARQVEAGLVWHMEGREAARARAALVEAAGEERTSALMAEGARFRQAEAIELASKLRLA